jgi:hypothetical protein
MSDLRSLLNGLGEIINLDAPKPDHIPQEQWDKLKEAFDKIYDDESED